MKEPTNLMRKTAAALFPDSEKEQENFLHALLHPRDRGSAIIWTGDRRETALQLASTPDIPEWLPDRISLLEPGEKPGSTEEYQNGDYYPLDFSSVLTGSALLALKEENTSDWNVLDLCAAPGGKSILASCLLQPARLVSNEVVGKRLGILRHNLRRCRIPRTFTQNRIAEDWASEAENSFHLCLVDAPCSGQSLLAKGKDNPGCFHPSIVKGNARRQLKMLRSVAAAVAPGGYLFYSTCTFATKENEGVIGKFLQSHIDFAPIEVPHLGELRSSLSTFPSYRIYPHRSSGAGGFVCLLKREGEIESQPIPEFLLRYPVEGSS